MMGDWGEGNWDSGGCFRKRNEKRQPWRGRKLRSTESSIVRLDRRREKTHQKKGRRGKRIISKKAFFRKGGRRNRKGGGRGVGPYPRGMLTKQEKKGEGGKIPCRPGGREYRKGV